MVKLCIMFLTDRERPFSFPVFVNEMSACKYVNDIDVLILSHDEDTGRYKSLLENTPLRYTVISVPSDNNYLRKIQITMAYIRQHGIPYLMKHDNDILMSHFVYDYLYENLNVLEDKKNIVLTPTLTSGIPTCELFFQDYLSEKQQDTLKKLFLQYRHGPLWGTDYTELNKYTLESDTWDWKAYANGVANRSHHYKGIHPVRMSKDAITELNRYVLEMKDKLFSKDSYEIVYDTTSPYFCNSIFCIHAETYFHILSQQDLYVDNYDEVPLNKWRDRHNLALAIVRKGVAIHPIYNTIDNYLHIEKEFVTALKRKTVEKKIDLTFGIITNGKNDGYLERLLQSIHYQQIPNYEILIVGSTSLHDPKVRVIPFDESQQENWITRKKNILSQQAKYDTIVFLHDYLYLSPQWYEGFLEFGDRFQICTSQTFYQSGKRCRDTSLFHYPLPDKYHKKALLPNNTIPTKSVNKLLYISGTYYVMKKSLALAFPLNETLSWGHGEDVELSHRLSDAGILLKSNPFSAVFYQKEKVPHAFEEELTEEEYCELESMPEATLEEWAVKQRAHLRNWLLKEHLIKL
jgi:hypothetical protein